MLLCPQLLPSLLRLTLLLLPEERCYGALLPQLLPPLALCLERSQAAPLGNGGPLQLLLQQQPAQQQNCVPTSNPVLVPTIFARKPLDAD